MAVLEILTAPDPKLKTVSKPVSTVDDALRDFMDDMLETMYKTGNGIGLAAIQVGVPKRIIVMDLSDDDQPDEPLFFINPEITWTSDEMCSREEGCLSVPEYFAEIERPARCGVKFLDYQGELREIDAEGLLATCIQHEMDHLNGILFIDRISALKRNMILKKLTKAQRQKLDAHTL